MEWQAGAETLQRLYQQESEDAQQLALRVNPRTGNLSWQWLPNLRTETFVAVVQE